MILSHALRKQCDECKTEGERDMEKIVKFELVMLFHKANYINKKKIINTLNRSIEKIKSKDFTFICIQEKK